MKELDSELSLNYVPEIFPFLTLLKHTLKNNKKMKARKSVATENMNTKSVRN